MMLPIRYIESAVPGVARLLVTVVAVAAVAQPVAAVAGPAGADGAAGAVGGADEAAQRSDPSDDTGCDPADEPTDEAELVVTAKPVWDRGTRTADTPTERCPAGPASRPVGRACVGVSVPRPLDAFLETDLRCRSLTAAPHRPHAPPDIR